MPGQLKKERGFFPQCGINNLSIHLIGPTWSLAHHSPPITVTSGMPSAHWLLRAFLGQEMDSASPE